MGCVIHDSVWKMLRRPSRRCTDNIKVDPKCVGKRRIYKAEVRDQCRGCVNVIMFFGFDVVRVRFFFLPGLGTVGVSRNSLQIFFFVGQGSI